jgi:hypothetical protein
VLLNLVLLNHRFQFIVIVGGIELTFNLFEGNLPFPGFRRSFGILA